MKVDVRTGILDPYPVSGYSEYGLRSSINTKFRDTSGRRRNPAALYNSSFIRKQTRNELNNPSFTLRSI